MSSTLATSDSALHQAVAYILPAVHTKHVRSVAADGTETEADENPWQGMEFKDPYLQTQPEDAAGIAAAGTAAAGTAAAAKPVAADDVADAAAEEEQEEQPKPEEVISAFTAAKGELEWLQLLLNTLQEGRYLTVGRSERSQGLQLLADMAMQSNSRYRKRVAAAASASDALSEGAAALKALGQKEDAFYNQVAQLQRYWKVRQEPPSSPYAYSVNLSIAAPDLISSSSSSSGGSGADGSNGSSSAAAGPESAAMIGRGPVDVIYILKDPAGNLRVQVPAAKTLDPPTVTFKGIEEPPRVYTGPVEIHALLLQQLRLNAWHMVVNSLDEEISSMLNLPTHLRHFLTAAQRHLGQQQQQQQQNKASQQQQKDGSGQQQQQQQQQAKFAELSGHLTLFASLSSLVLQAVAGAAGTAGEAVLLQQQQQQQQGDDMAVDTQGPTSHFSDGIFSPYDIDVGRPWQRAAAEAAARLGSSSTSTPWPTATAAAAAPAVGINSNGGNGSIDGGSKGSSSSSGVVVDPQLLSMRPLALEHLLSTQLGHLVSSLRNPTNEPALMAPIAYAAAARQMQERARQRQQQQQQQQGSQSADQGTGASAAAAAAQLAIKPGSLKFGRQIAFLHLFARWLQHAAHRDVLRAQVDEVLQHRSGIAARSLSSTHICVSAMELNKLASQPAASSSAAAAAAAAARPTAAAAAPLLLLLTDSQLSIETTAALAAAAAAAAGDGSGGLGFKQQGTEGVLASAALSALSVQPQGVSRALQQLLQQLEPSADL